MAPLTKSVAALGMLVTLFTTTAFADTYRHIDELALQIQRNSLLLLRETSHYRHTPEYRHLLNDTREIYRLATHMHSVAHRHGSISHLDSDLRELDAQFHHLESVFRRVERDAAHGHGHVHGYTGHVKELLHCLEDDIHHLQDDLRSLRTPIHHPRVIVSRPVVPAIPHHGHRKPHGKYGHNSHSRGRGFGLTIGGGSSQFTLRF